MVGLQEHRAPISLEIQVSKLANGSPLHDDVTLVVVTVKG